MKKFIILVIAAATAAFLISCQGGMEGEQDPVGTAYLKIAHLIPQAAPLDLWLNDHLLTDSVNFPRITPRIRLADGVHRISASRTGVVPPQFLVDVLRELPAGGFYTVVVAGMASSVIAVLLADDPVPDPQWAKVRFVHASPNCPAVDLQVGDGAATVWYANRTYPHDTDYLRITPGWQPLRVGFADADTAFFVIPGYEFAANMNYSVYLAGLLGDVDPAAIALHVEREELPIQHNM